MRKIEECVILIVDDTEMNIDLLIEALGDTYEIMVALDGPTALEHLNDHKPDLILLDIMMPGMDGFEVCQRIRQNPEKANVPIIFVTALNESVDEQRGLDMGAVDYIIKPINPAIVKARVRNHLELKLAREILKDENLELEHRVQERTRLLHRTQDATIECLATLAETRDPETGNHIRRTKRYVKVMAENLAGHPDFSPELDARRIDLLYKSTPLHDVGKVGVPDHILLKPGPLTPEEFEIMKQHTVIGRDALLQAEKTLGDDSFLRIAAEIAYTHHERWDGSGYPRGLKGAEIPLSGRLMSIADVYDALICKRVYKPAFSHEKTVSVITQGDGRVMPAHFDPRILSAFTALADRFQDIARQFSDDETSA